MKATCRGWRRSPVRNDSTSNPLGIISAPRPISSVARRAVGLTAETAAPDSRRRKPGPAQRYRRRTVREGSA